MVDDALAREVAEAAGVDLSGDVEHVVTGLRAWLPGGSTVKLDAIAAGSPVPGADPSHALVERLAGSTGGWSCWPMCTAVGGVLAAAGHDVTLMVEHRRERLDVEVDFHSLLVVDGDLVDPYLGPAAPVSPGSQQSRPDAWSQWGTGVRPDHFGVRGGGSRYRYRFLADRLDPDDVRAFCAISVTHSGVGDRRYLQWVVDGSIHEVKADEPGLESHGTYRVSSGSDPFTQRRDTVDSGSFAELVERHLPPA